MNLTFLLILVLGLGFACVLIEYVPENDLSELARELTDLVPDAPDGDLALHKIVLVAIIMIFALGLIRLLRH